MDGEEDGICQNIIWHTWFTMGEDGGGRGETGRRGARRKELSSVEISKGAKENFRFPRNEEMNVFSGERGKQKR